MAGLDGFSPEVQAWLLGLGPDPFAMYEDQNSQVIGNWLPPEDPDEIGTMDWQNDRLTAQNKANNQYSDMAQIAQLGGSTGGSSPDQFEPFATYEPVQAPGYMMLNYYKASSSPIMSYIAKRFEENATALEIESEVRKLVESDPEAAEAMPITTDDMGNTMPDWKRLSGEIATLEKNIINDPEFNYIGPETGGKPGNVKYVDTEIAKWYKERGLPNPYETYSPDLLAGRDQLSREGMNRDKQSESDIEFDVAKRVLSAARAKADPRNNDKPFGMTLDGQPQPTSGGGSPDPAAWLDRNIGDPVEDFVSGLSVGIGHLGGDESGGKIPIPSVMRQRGTTGSIGDLTGAPAGPRIPSRRGNASAKPEMNMGQRPMAFAPGGAGDRRADVAQEAARKAFTSAILARKENDKRRSNSADDKISQIDRQRMMAMLTKQGRTPFNDVNRARQGNVYGF